MPISAAVPKHSIIETVEPLMRDAAARESVELYDLEYVKEGRDRILRLYIDKEGGVDLSDCERVSRAAERELDAADPLPEAYVLEVSSPGVERRLRRDAHFARYVGARVELRLFKPVNGTRTVRGTLSAFTGGALTVADGQGAETRYDRAAVARCRLVVFED